MIQETSTNIFVCYCCVTINTFNHKCCVSVIDEPGFLFVTLTEIKLFLRYFLCMKCDGITIGATVIQSVFQYVVFRGRSWLLSAILEILSHFIEIKVSLIKILVKHFYTLWTKVRIWYKLRYPVYMIAKVDYGPVFLYI